MSAGSATVDAQATDRLVRTRLYRDGVLEKENFPVADLSEYLEEPGTVLWVDLCAPDRTDLQIVADELGLHALAVEDAVSPRQRAKLDRYDTHDFMSLYAIKLDHDSAGLRLSELAASSPAGPWSPSARTRRSTWTRWLPGGTTPATWRATGWGSCCGV